VIDSWADQSSFAGARTFAVESASCSRRRSSRSIHCGSIAAAAEGESAVRSQCVLRVNAEQGWAMPMRSKIAGAYGATEKYQSLACAAHRGATRREPLGL
jgi:hypothetical protein